MSIVLTAILSMLTDAFASAFADNLTDELWAKVQGDPVRNALKQAIGTAIQRYGTTGSRLELAHALLKQNGVLTDPSVAQEFAQIIRFDREPNAELIGQRWKALLENPPRWRNFTEEARLLLDYVRIELRNTEVFRPVFDSRSIDALNSNTAISAVSLANIEAELESLIELMDAKFGDLNRIFAGSSGSIYNYIRDYTRFIEEKTRGFVGRQFVFNAITKFVQDNPRGYFFIQGDPGIGKSSLAAQIVKNHGYVHHFNIRAEGINKAEAFLRNTCAQLIAAYNLDHTILPVEAIEDTGFLNQLLGEVSDKLGAGEKAIIIVDALDEVDNFGLSPTANKLFLPISLPRGTYIIVTSRKGFIDLRIECEHGVLEIKQDSIDNITDIRTYIKQVVKRPGMQDYIAAQNIDGQVFIEHLAEKSQGNFMYLRYVLPEIERGAYKDLGLDAIPLGLQNYYEDHWRRMRGKDEEAWFDYKIPIIMALTVVKEPVSIDLIMDFSGVQERSRVRSVLREWSQFLYEKQVESDGALQKRYRIYHTSFQDFIVNKEDVQDERVSRKEAHMRIADSLWSEIFDNE